MSADLEDRLRRYGRVLDAEAEAEGSADRPSARSGGRRLIALATAAAVAAAVLVAVGVFAGGDSGREVKVASGASDALKRGDDGAFPLLLVEGWEVTRFDERSGPMSGAGGGRYHTAETAFSRRGHELEFHQSEGDRDQYEALVSDRVASAVERWSTSVLGYPAEVTRYGGSQRHAAMWLADGVVYELDGDAGDADAFSDALAALRVVDGEEWEAALPESTIVIAEREAAVDGMLRDIPQPPGFDPSPLRRGEHAEDRYQLGARVTRAVSCGWLERWWDARSSGDKTTTDEAVAAMATSRDWQILNEMNAAGDYPEGVWEFAAAMPAPEESAAGKGMLRELRNGNCPL